MKTRGPDEVSQFEKNVDSSLFDMMKWFVCPLKTGSVLRAWKRADIIPILKSLNKEEHRNYSVDEQ